MWRLWTSGWGIRAWAYWVVEATPRKIAFLMPRKVALWAFIRVYSACEQSPGEEYCRAYDAWESRYDLRPKPPLLDFAPTAHQSKGEG